jgi:membrane protease YdiL (CAAX protease family)
MPPGETGPPDPGAAPAGGALSGSPAGGRPRRGILASLWPLALILVVSATGLGLASLYPADGEAKDSSGEQADLNGAAPAPSSVRERVLSSGADTSAVEGLSLAVLACGLGVLVSLLFVRTRRWLLPPPGLAPRATWGAEQLAYGVALALGLTILSAAAAGLLRAPISVAGVLLHLAAQIAVAGVVIAIVLTRPGIIPAEREPQMNADERGFNVSGREARLPICVHLRSSAVAFASLGISFKGTGPNALRGVVGGLGAFSLAIAASIGGVLVSELVGSPVRDHPVIRRIFSAGAAETAVLVAGACVVAPVVEEIFFRGFIYPVLRDRWGMLAGVVASALAFAAVHPGLPNQAATFVLGAALAALYERSGTLVAPVVAHALFNGVQIGIVLLARAAG